MKYDQIEISRWPVVIYANYRSGSNVLGKSLAAEYNAKWYPEPIRDTTRYTSFLNHYYSEDKKYIVKFMPDQKDQIKETKDIFNSDCFKIRLIRKDEFEQIVSYYIASCRDQWVQNTPTVGEYSLGIDYKILEFVIETIKNNNKKLYEDQTVFDHTLFYEDLDFENNASHIFKTTPPKNIDSLRSIIKRIYDHI